MLEKLALCHPYTPNLRPASSHDALSPVRLHDLLYVFYDSACDGLILRCLVSISEDTDKLRWERLTEAEGMSYTSVIDIHNRLAGVFSLSGRSSRSDKLIPSFIGDPIVVLSEEEEQLGSFPDVLAFFGHAPQVIVPSISGDAAQLVLRKVECLRDARSALYERCGRVRRFCRHAVQCVKDPL